MNVIIMGQSLFWLSNPFDFFFMFIKGRIVNTINIEMCISSYYGGRDYSLQKYFAALKDLKEKSGTDYSVWVHAQ